MFKRLWMKIITWWRHLEFKPLLPPTAAEVYLRHSAGLPSMEEVWQRDREKVAQDMQRAGIDVLQAARDAILNGRVIVVAYKQHIHEIDIDAEQTHDPVTRERFGTTKCGLKYTVKMDSVFLMAPRKLDCPGCLLKRAELN